jgi:hypothetical protein
VPGRDERALGAIADEIERMEEPYRTALRLRFLEDLPPRRIATELALPIQTVYTRLARGSGLLRTRLERRLGALAPLLLAKVDRTRTLPRLARPQRVMRLSLATCAVLAAGAPLLLATFSRDAEHVTSHALDVTPPIAPSRDVRYASSAPTRAREPALVEPVSTASASETVTQSPDYRLQRGRVLDASGRPVAGVEVRLEVMVARYFRTSQVQAALRPTELLARTVSRADGSFELDTPLFLGAWVSACAADSVPLVSVATPAQLGTDCIVPIVAPRSSSTTTATGTRSGTR